MTKADQLKSALKQAEKDIISKLNEFLDDERFLGEHKAYATSFHNFLGEETRITIKPDAVRVNTPKVALTFVRGTDGSISNVEMKSGTKSRQLQLMRFMKDVKTEDLNFIDEKEYKALKIEELGRSDIAREASQLFRGDFTDTMKAKSLIGHDGELKKEVVGHFHTPDHSRVDVKIGKSQEIVFELDRSKIKKKKPIGAVADKHGLKLSTTMSSKEVEKVITGFLNSMRSKDLSVKFAAKIQKTSGKSCSLGEEKEISSSAQQTTDEENGNLFGEFFDAEAAAGVLKLD